MCWYVMKQYVDEYGTMQVRAARISPYTTIEKAKKKMNKVGKGAFLINRYREVVFVK